MSPGNPARVTKASLPHRTEPDPVFGFDVVTECPDVPAHLLTPRATWSDPSAYDAAARRLAGLFSDNFKTHEAGVSADIKAVNPS